MNEGTHGWSETAPRCVRRCGGRPGLPGYDAWIKAFQGPKALDHKAGGFGQAYNAQCWAECRRHAVAFLEEARQRLGAARLKDEFDEAVRQYKVVRDNLDAVAKLFPFHLSDPKGMGRRIKEAPTRAKAARALAAARKAEVAGLRALARIAVALGAKDIDVNKVGEVALPPEASKAEPPAPSRAAPRAIGGMDYSKLKLEGNGHTQDSFSLAVQAAARLLGKRPDYEMIYCLSSNAFAPAIDKGEDCTAWWHVQGWMGDRATETVAGRLGLRTERLALPPDELSPGNSKEVFERKALAARKRAATVLRKAMEAGKVVITSGGWRTRDGGGFVPWCWWGIITRADDDGNIAGSCLRAVPGQRRGVTRPMDYVGDRWAISSGKPTLTAHEADVTMLRQAVARIRGTGACKEDKRAAYGLAAMDVWIAKMKQVPFCAPCSKVRPDGPVGCALNNGQTTSAGAKVAASHLRKRKGAFKAEPRRHMQAAAGHYDRIVELLTPALTGKGGPRYRQFIGDAHKQKAHAKVLQQVKAELAAAADEMEKALAAEGAEKR